jgi:hypothetical protein
MAYNGLIRLVETVALINVEHDLKVLNMAKKIESCLELTGQDAIDFKNYLANPQYTACGREMLEKAYALSKSDSHCKDRTKHKD